MHISCIVYTCHIPWNTPSRSCNLDPRIWAVPSTFWHSRFSVYFLFFSLSSFLVLLLESIPRFKRVHQLQYDSNNYSALTQWKTFQKVPIFFTRPLKHPLTWPGAFTKVSLYSKAYTQKKVHQVLYYSWPLGKIAPVKSHVTQKGHRKKY